MGKKASNKNKVYDIWAGIVQNDGNIEIGRLAETTGAPAVDRRLRSAIHSLDGMGAIYLRNGMITLRPDRYGSQPYRDFLERYVSGEATSIGNVKIARERLGMHGLNDIANSY